MATLLLVEDHEEIWDFLSRRLRRKGHDVVVANDGRSGVDAVRANRPDLILMDVNLPVLDGYSAVRELRADEATREIPVIALTAHAMTGDREKAIAAGCTDYHPKPIDFSRLLEQIETALASMADAG
ncbi:response regulator [Sphingomonas sp. Leaf20]|uniref:response regulator n=1 Tax=Sphingomonas sp. Leaf20 TaxID=1735685 RepID=UPI0006FA851F|nr:response regulator [Sphingomonas sp. Leaf20]KQM69145.1 two-component system response regulator [Sphingomonas sp. Leaf20]